MTEFGRLLKEAAGTPPQPLDMVAIRQRAARLGWRSRASLWLAAVVGVVGIGTPVATTVLSPGGSGQHVNAVAPPTEPRAPSEDLPESLVTSEPAAQQSLQRSTPRERVTAPAAAAAASSTPTIAPAAVDPAASTTTSAITPTGGTAADVPAAAPFCSVDNRSLRGGESRRCRFSATTAGGWNYFNQRRDESLSGGVDATVFVIRDGVTAIYRTEKTSTPAGSNVSGCADNIIEPGDVVEVVITQRSGQYWTEEHAVEDMAKESEGAGAGSQWGCTDPGP